MIVVKAGKRLRGFRRLDFWSRHIFEYREDALQSCLRSEAVFFAENFHSTVFHELIRPPDANDRQMDAFLGQMFHHRATVAVVEYVVFKGAKNLY